MASIKPTPNGNWKAQVRRKGWPTVCKTFRLKADASNWATQIEDEMRRGIYINSSKSESTTLKEALNRYLESISTLKKPSTEKRDTCTAKTLARYLGQYSLAALTQKRIANYRDTRLKEGLSNNSVRIELALLSHLFTTSIQEWQLGLTVNPVFYVSKPPSGKGRTRRLSKSEEKILLKALKQHSNPMLLWVAQIALYTAMRQGEILSLTHKQVNVSRRVVVLSDSKNGNSRTVPLSNRAIEVFKQALNNPIRPFDTDLIFFGEPGKDGRRRPYTVGKVWNSALKKSELINFRFHDLRHEATSRLIQSGKFSDQEVASITGHQSMQMLKRYTHLRAEDLTDKIKDL